MGEFEKKTDEELQKALKAISKDIRRLINSYSPNTAVSMKTMSKKLLQILEKHG